MLSSKVRKNLLVKSSEQLSLPILLKIPILKTPLQIIITSITTRASITKQRAAVVTIIQGSILTSLDHLEALTNESPSTVAETAEMTPTMTANH